MTTEDLRLLNIAVDVEAQIKHVYLVLMNLSSNE